MNNINTIEGNNMLNQIDEVITQELIELKSLVNGLEFTQITEFTLNESLFKICDQNDNYPGIYLFEIKNSKEQIEAAAWMEAFISLWGHSDYERHFVPNVKKKRVKVHVELSDWIPIYLGKSKNIGFRINEHLLKELDKTTFAMKLKARKNLFGNIFRVRAIRVEVKNYDVILPILESELRNKLNPIIGKQ